MAINVGTRTLFVVEPPNDLNSTFSCALSAKSVPNLCLCHIEVQVPQPTGDDRIGVCVLSGNYEFSFWETESYSPPPLSFCRRNRHAFPSLFGSQALLKQ